ncbi:hypothetical protein ANN_08489 [Periplaneta americana]|uniref:Uncharacterized protein n=1 Tax=Periplaneta americana TaxID=6978 RepID=A0ABQ8T1K2_PERAM|nr:hypothetical protein ANN_08489 [Periplaneta americana]
MVDLREGGNEPPGSLKAISFHFLLAVVIDMSLSVNLELLQEIFNGTPTYSQKTRPCSSMLSISISPGSCPVITDLMLNLFNKHNRVDKSVSNIRRS